MMSTLKVGVLTVSDRCSRGEAEDKSGPNLVKLLCDTFSSCQSFETSYECVEDDKDVISAKLLVMCDEHGLHLILTTGGTGFSQRDVTPEATGSVIERLTPGLSTAMLVKSLEITPMAMLSRSVCGIRGKCLIVNLPGSLKASTECFHIIRPALQHALDLLRDSPAVGKTHEAMAARHATKTSSDSSTGHAGHHKHAEGHGHKHAHSSGQADDHQHHHHHDHDHQRHDNHHRHHSATHSSHHSSHSDHHRRQHQHQHQHHQHQHHQHQHQQLQPQQHVCPHRSPAGPAVNDADKVARRARHSPYPMIPMAEATATVMKNAERLGTVSLLVSKAQGYILASPVFAVDALPPFPASVKDGYAVVASDGPGERNVVGPVTAGDSPSIVIKSGEVARISTGACLPEGADAVVQVEDTELLEDAEEGRVERVVRIKSSVTAGHDIRPVGFDIQKGECVLQAGDALGAAELGLLASIGVTKVDVIRKPKVGVMSTGNELCDPDVEQLPPGHIRDSNRTMLLAALRDSGFDVLDLGIAVDKPDVLAEGIQNALDKVDVLITSGGVSMGEKDLLKSVLTERFGGTLHFGRVFMKPGKPTTFVTIPTFGSDGQQRLVFALPGNPVSALVSFHLFALPALRQMAGFASPALPIIHVKLAHDVHLDPRPEYQRCAVKYGSAVDASTGAVSPFPEVSTTGSQCSSRLLSMRSANALLCLPARTDAVSMLKAGSIVQAQIIGNL